MGDPVGEEVERESRSTGKSTISERFVERTKTALEELMGRRLEDVRLAVMMLDGIDIAERTHVVALGITTDGVNLPLGLWEGSTENATLARSLLADLVDRGLDPVQAMLFVIDGGKALRRAIKDVFGEQALVHRCHRHKERNVTDLLPERDRPEVLARIRGAWSLKDADVAQERLERLACELDRTWPDAAGSLREGLEDTLTLMRLGITGQLAKTLCSTNPCESMIEIVRHTQRNVKRWQDGDMRKRWTAAGLLVADRAPRRPRQARHRHQRNSHSGDRSRYGLTVISRGGPSPSSTTNRTSSGGVLINVSDLPAAAARALRAVSGAARGTVVMHAGLAPGVTTIVAADLLSRHPAASELELVFTLSLAAHRGPPSAEFIYRGLTVVSRHRTALVRLPRPFGVRRCLGFGESDAGWLGGIAEGRVVRQYVCIAEPAMHERLLELNRAGAMTDLPSSTIELPKQRATRTGDDEPVAHWIAAIHAGRRLGARTVECMGGSRSAARSTVVFADALRAEPAPPGCFGPEEMDAERPQNQATSRRNRSRVTSTKLIRPQGLR